MLVTLASLACALGDRAPDAAAELPLDSIDPPVAVDTLPLAAPVDPIDTTRPTPISPTPGAAADAPASRPLPAPSRPSVDTVRAVAVVQGRAELEVDGTTYLPADYLLVRLQSGRITVMEAWTTRGGEFFFRNVRPGTYELHFLASPKEPRPIYRRSISIGGGDNVRLPVVHIPVDSIKSPARAEVR